MYMLHNAQKTHPYLLWCWIVDAVFYSTRGLRFLFKQLFKQLLAFVEKYTTTVQKTVFLHSFLGTALAVLEYMYVHLEKSSCPKQCGISTGRWGSEKERDEQGWHSMSKVMQQGRTSTKQKTLSPKSNALPITSYWASLPEAKDTCSCARSISKADRIW